MNGIDNVTSPETITAFGGLTEFHALAVIVLLMIAVAGVWIMKSGKISNPLAQGAKLDAIKIELDEIKKDVDVANDRISDLRKETKEIDVASRARDADIYEKQRQELAGLNAILTQIQVSVGRIEGRLFEARSD